MEIQNLGKTRWVEPEIASGMGKCPVCGKLRGELPIIQMGMCSDCIADRNTRELQDCKEYEEQLKDSQFLIELSPEEFHARLKKLIEDLCVERAKPK